MTAAASERQSCRQRSEGGSADEEAIDAFPGAVVHRAGACRVRGDGCRDAGLLPDACSAHAEAFPSESHHLLAGARIPDATVSFAGEGKARDEERATWGATAASLQQISAGSPRHGYDWRTSGC